MDQVTSLGGGVHQPPLAICKILSRSNDPSPRYLLPNFVNFVAGVTHKSTKQQKSKEYVSALHVVTTNTQTIYIASKSTMFLVRNRPQCPHGTQPNITGMLSKNIKLLTAPTESRSVTMHRSSNCIVRYKNIDNY